MEAQRLNTLETNQALMQKDLSHIKEAVDEIKTTIKSFDDRYAWKLSEKIVYWLVTIILLSVIGALVTLVIR